MYSRRCEKPQIEGSLQVSQGSDVTGSEQGAEHAQPFTAESGDEEKCSTKRDQDNPSLILDSGARYHVTGVKTLLSEFTVGTLDPDGSATTAFYHARDGRVLPVAGVGTLACDNFHLSNVLFVPGLGTGVTPVAGLVSLRQLAERDCLVIFGGGRCYVKDQSSGKLVGQGRLHEDDGLYHLQFLRIESCSVHMG